MKPIFRYLGIIIFFIILCSSSFAQSHRIIRLAVFDNPQPDPSNNENSQQFGKSYLSGINTAITVAASKGIYITEKEFFHANDLANIVQQAANLKTWKPDVIMGLSTSNDFLMSKAFFGDQIILSISATDAALSKLPPGFYSLGIPDTDAVNAIIKFVHQHYQHPNLFITVAAESKESVDFASLLAKKYKYLHPEQKVTEHKFLTEDMNQLDLTKFMADYKKNDVIIIMSIGYDSAIDLMNKISAYLRPIKPIFITSTDNWGNDNSPQKISDSYNAFRIDTLSGGDEDTANYKVFLENFKKIYHASPTDKISFVTYQTVMSFVEAAIQYPFSNSVTKTALLNSYLKALSHNSNWFRPKYYVVYKLENHREVFFEKLS